MSLSEFMHIMTFPGKVIFAKVWGSHSHDTCVPESDWDFSGVYVVPTKKLLGIKKIVETVNNETGKPDYTFHEIGKFCDLLLKGNPGIVEMLWTDRMMQDSMDWQSLKGHRKRFLSKEVVLQYVGYAEGQLKRLRSGKCLHTSGSSYNEKWAYHLMRLLTDAERIVRGGEPVVWKEGSERDYLMSIRTGKISQEEVESHAQQRLDTVRAILEGSTLPETGDADLLERWLVGLRLDYL